MEYDDDTQAINFISGLLLGAILGVGVALLTAPQPGQRTRRRIQRAAVDLRENATDRWDDLADDVKGKVDDAIEHARKRFVT